ncbi:MAG: group II intron maturase-specific domain-containing protein, partial [Terriglobia bacterium]
SLAAIITNLNRTLRGWYGYFQHRHVTTFTALDQWVRTRLRGILRRRRGGRGRARGADHQRWPNAFFSEQGVFSLITAQATTRQSSGR